MDEETLKPQLMERFPGIEEDVLIQCTSICKTFNITPEDLRYKWEALIYNSSIKDKPISFFDANCARDLQQQLQRDLAKTSQTKAKTTKTSVAKRPMRGNALGANPFAPPAGRTRTGPSVKVEPSTPSISSHQNLSTGRPVNFSMPQDYESYRYRYMHEKLYERASILDEQIDRVAEKVLQHYKLEELADPSRVTLDEVVVVGRIVDDGDAKIGETSTLLESSRMMGSGVRVPLEFDANLKTRCASKRATGSTGVDLFPGMIAALKGKNGSGNSFVVSEILRLPPLPINSKSEAPSSLKALIACGPFTFESDLDYKPLLQVVEAARTERPDLLLLLGPFVDSNHPLIKAGQVDLSPASLFRERISKHLTRLEADMPELVIVLVPSLRDLISNHVVLPQAALERDPELGLSRVCVLRDRKSFFTEPEAPSDVKWCRTLAFSQSMVSLSVQPL
ncbi:DNA polymerase alpha subunit B [Ceratobasidium sp. AG-Ba]|nr:DNA polymerase alpha subunit B [Ceratobasidium sp. AG-Ba]QRW06651.1 DNA polymerase alpha subunit B [Ceratobasidium sp. AG-Ba]